jgi:hypothetical protein
MRKTIFSLLILLVFVSCLSAFFGQQAQPAMPREIQRVQSDQETTQSIGRTLQEYLLSVAVLLFGLVIIWLLTRVILKMKTDQPWESSYVKLVGLVVVITAGLFLICAGYSQHQIAPMIGLLGTIAGYLLGKEAPKGQAVEKKKK